MRLPVSLLVVALFGCASSTESTPCRAGDSMACTCDDGAKGIAVCGPSGQHYGNCTCAGDAAGDGSSDATDDAIGDAVGEAGGLPLLSVCVKDADCASGLCYAFPSKGPHCSKTCSGDGDCPAPSPGCTPSGVCRLP